MPNTVKSRILEIFEASQKLRAEFLSENLEIMEHIARALVSVLREGKKIILFGNGGSAADAQHIAAEFVNRYLIDRPPLAAVALTTDSSVMTSIANDFGYEEVFEKQVRALGTRGDAAIGISTSGKSPNVIRALTAAQQNGLITVGIGGPVESPMQNACTYYLSVQGGPTPRIQEVHQIIGHTLVEIVDEMLFGTAFAGSKAI
ncbi:D-sedoheptulose-7-phosphate isomerase [Desulfomonile tiedjei]|uniref:Phosphoheptose isomerase n=1 Tax=Desulfomonile tiedjei (strain ATCC 49306 / DSM 6799 / DCB-1) TaxID=706587 RepID=I4C442_DESTA|nr:SIS domain-containing protein [Desulfomonile tiedjei]AFM24333.1 phosphoheptose isomerase [Desulfomonile tiedjei DSM 6799]